VYQPKQCRLWVIASGSQVMCKNTALFYHVDYREQGEAMPTGQPMGNWCVSCDAAAEVRLR
jgi:hypothetical protein